MLNIDGYESNDRNINAAKIIDDTFFFEGRFQNFAFLYYIYIYIYWY